MNQGKAFEMAIMYLVRAFQKLLRWCWTLLNAIVFTPAHRLATDMLWFRFVLAFLHINASRTLCCSIHAHATCTRAIIFTFHTSC
jgi:hypothetical protein